MLEDIGNLFSIEHAGAILGQPPARPQLREDTLSEGALAPFEPYSGAWGVLTSDSLVPNTRNPECTLKVMIFHWKMINTKTGRERETT